MMHSELTTVGSVIDAFGGIERFCARFKFNESQVSTWKWRGKFSDRAKISILVASRELNLNVAPTLLGLEAAE